jgi:plasmid rolling circle replication initiator protein Rep
MVVLPVTVRLFAFGGALHHHSLFETLNFNNMQKDNLKNETPADANNVLATVPYKFFYKDKFGQMGSKVVEVNKKDCELAIAKFERENPEIVWRSFTAL